MQCDIFRLGYNCPTSSIPTCNFYRIKPNPYLTGQPTYLQALCYDRFNKQFKIIT